ncbi:hypothetical protein EW146_g4362 [Bondarzewia mesenterica]|uniref:DUF300-domain-containing protein n=1 Tax=Bondarzewia mesenterica TaxID=1095465 RepID=A0A4V6S1G6_9AGAM|nr:hypothetical protein EW146_g4362 [Bondarzewia mesenterica]
MPTWTHSDQDNSTPLLLVRDCYESIVLTAFFYLLLTYLSPDPEEQKDIFRKEGLSREHDSRLIARGEKPGKSNSKMSLTEVKPPGFCQDGMHFLQLMKWAVLQYCVIRPTTTFAAIILNYVGLYCEQSWSPAWGHIYVSENATAVLERYNQEFQISAIVSISVTVAMYCLLQLYFCVSKQLAPQNPVLKLFSVKAVVFLTFWQASALSLLSMAGLIKDTPYMTAEDINVGWGALLETFEMMIFAFIHIRAFSYKPYRPRTPDAQRTPRLRALGHAMDFRETFRELKAGCIYVWHRTRGIETDTRARRERALEGAFGKSRTQLWRKQEKGEAGGQVEVDVEVDRVMMIEGERQWLGIGNDYGHGLIKRDRSDGLEEQIEKELSRRGYAGLEYPQEVEAEASEGHVRGRRSWWRSIYDRVSQSNPDQDEGRFTPLPKREKRPSWHSTREDDYRALMYEDPPPPSIIQTYRSNRRLSKDAIVSIFSTHPPPTNVTDTIPSSQSHHTHVHLGALPIAISKDVNTGRVPKLTVPKPAPHLSPPPASHSPDNLLWLPSPQPEQKSINQHRSIHRRESAFHKSKPSSSPSPRRSQSPHSKLSPIPSSQWHAPSDTSFNQKLSNLVSLGNYDEFGRSTTPTLAPLTFISPTHRPSRSPGSTSPSSPGGEMYTRPGRALSHSIAPSSRASSTSPTSPLRRSSAARHSYTHRPSHHRNAGASRRMFAPLESIPQDIVPPQMQNDMQMPSAAPAHVLRWSLDVGRPAPTSPMRRPYIGPSPSGGT